MQATILIIDDEPANIASLAEALGKEHTIRVASSGKEGIEAAKVPPLPDLILLDIIMPEISGYEVCTYLKGNPDLSHIPIIFITGKSSVQDEITGLEMGAEDYLIKPFNLRLVQQRVKAHLRRTAELTLRESRRLYKNIIDQGMDAFVMVSEDRKQIVQYNRQAYEGLGYTENEFQKLTLPDIQEKHSADAEKQINSILEKGSGIFEARHITKTREHLYVMVSVRAVEVGGKRYFVDIWRDQTQQRQAEEKLNYLSLHDQLTGLANRRQLIERVTRSINRQKRTAEGFAVHFIDIHHFKGINDSYGNETGDAILKAVGKKLKQIVRDLDIVARLGADEFAIVQTGIKRADQAVMLVERILEGFKEPFDTVSGKIRIDISIGVVACDQQTGSSVNEIIKNGEVALNLAREKGHGQYAFHTKTLTEQYTRRLFIGAELKKALETKQGLFVVFQPQVIVADTPQIIGVEALVRWINKEEFISPAEFIPIAEERGLICSLGAFVLCQSCIQWKSWTEKHGFKIKLAVNVAPQEIVAPGYTDQVMAILKETEMPAEYLELEITEHSFAMGDDSVKKVMDKLVAQGVTFSIDDFGTGFSSLLYLKQLPVTKLKIAREFIADMEEDATSEIVNATITMAHGLGLVSLAEGVEKESQINLLKKAGCQQVQGFHYYKPMPADEFTDLLSGKKKKDKND